MSLYFAVEIEGLRNPLSTTDPNRVLFVHGDLSALTLPGSFTNTTISPMLENNDPGEGWNADLRKPISSGGDQVIRLLDTKEGALGKICLFDPTEDTWDIRSSRVDIGQTIIGVTGRSGVPPTLGFYWIEEECVRVTAVAPVVILGGGISPIDWDLTVTRAQCGSRDVVHMISTSALDPGDPGSETLLTLWKRPNFGAFKFRGTMYLLNAPYAAHPATIIDAAHFFIDEEPLSGIPSYEFKLKNVSEVIENHTFQIGIDTRLQFRMLVVSEGTETSTTAASGGNVTTIRKLPNECKLYLGRLGAAQLFGEPLSEPLQNGFNATKVTSLRTRMQANADINYYVKLKTRDSEWLFIVTQVVLSDQSIGAGFIPFVEVSLTLRDYPKGQSIDGEPDSTDAATGDQTYIDTYPNTAFTRSAPLPGSILGLLGHDEDPPTLQLWYGLTCGPVDAYLYLTTSNGGFSADPYDAIIGKGLGIPADWQSRGVAPPAALDVRWDTRDLLELRELLNGTYTYYVKSGDKLGVFLGGLCILHTLLHGPRNDGSMTLIRWARHREGETIVTLDEDISVLVNPGERLTPLRAFLLYSGIKLLTLEPEFVRSVTLGGVAYRETGEPLPVRVWQPGNQLTNELLVQGQIGHLLRAFFSMMGGAPIRLSISTSILKQNLEIGAFVNVTNNRIPTPQGRGLVSVRHVVVGADTNRNTGQKTYRLMRDYYGELRGTVGLIAPTLTPSIPIDLGGGLFEVPLGSLGDPSFNPAGSHNGIWGDIQNVEGFVHLQSPDLHNPTDQADREGWGEAYGQVIALVPDSGTGQGRLVVQFDPAWSRGGITVEQLLTPNSIMGLVDKRPATSNPQGVDIAPVGQQLATGNDFLAVSAANSFQRNFSQVG